jgi:hypothetical protein
MKKIFKTTLIVALCLIAAFPFNSFAADGEKIQWFDIDLTENEIQRILDLNPQNNTSTRATGLILAYNVGIAKDGTNLNLVAKLVCDLDVVKCGFKKILIQRRSNANVAWSTCFTFEDLYDDCPDYLIARQIAVTGGYQYRAVCTFYAKKNILSTQKIELASNIVTFA